MKGLVDGLLAILGLVVVWAVCLLALGAALRLMKELFCLGYGC